MKLLKYYEYNVQLDGGKIVEKMPTPRKHVTLYPHDAERNNSTVKQTKLWYELADAPKEEFNPVGDKVDDSGMKQVEEKEERKALFAIARKEMGLVVQNTISTEDLRKLIADKK